MSRDFKKNLLAVVVGALLPLVAPAETRYVSKNGFHQYPFTNWLMAARNIQAAVDASTDGDVIQMWRGRYTGAGNRDIDFGGKAVMLQSQSGFSNTFIDCEQAGRGFYFHSGETTSSRLRICGALSNGVRIESAGPLIQQCSIVSNIGSGVYCVDGSAVIEDSFFIGNCPGGWNSRTAEVYIARDNRGQPVWIQCVTNCYAEGNGGAVFALSSTVVLSRCVFRDNVAGEDGGAIYAVTNSSILLRDTLMASNRCGFRSHYDSRTAIVYDSQHHEVFRSVTESNDTDGCGGAIFCLGSTLVMENCSLVGNEATTAGGGLFYGEGSSVRIDGCTIAGNYAGSTVTGITSVIRQYDDDGQMSFERMTCQGDWTGDGGGMFCNDSSLTVSNSMVYGNRAFSAGGGLFCSGVSTTLMYGCTFVRDIALSPASATTLTVIGYDSHGQEFYRIVETTNSAWDSGGAICATGSVTLLIDGTRIASNAAAMGGGLCCFSGTVVSLAGVDIMGNRAVRSEGGVRITAVQYDSFDREVYRSVDWRESAGGRGGGGYFENSALSLSNCRISANEAGDAGGGIACTSSADVDIRRCVVDGNRLLTAATNKNGSGAGVAFFASSGALTECVLSNNITGEHVMEVMITGYHWDGNVAYRYFETDARTLGSGGGLYSALSAVTLDACHVVDNSAGIGGGGISFCDATVFTNRNCVITRNLAVRHREEEVVESVWETSTTRRVSAVETGAAIYARSSTGSIWNCTIMANNTLEHSDTLRLESNSVFDLHNVIFWDNGVSLDSNSVIGAEYSCVRNGYPGAGNTSNDPLLTFGFRLRDASPCIDAGIDADAPAADIDGEARWDHPGHLNSPSIVDIGADEFVDSDSDLMADRWEEELFGSVGARNGFADADADALNDRDEYEIGTDPQGTDSDGDGMIDGWEVLWGLYPTADDAGEDPDSDFLCNVAEYQHFLSPWDPDADGDGLLDGQEVASGTDPLDSTSYLHVAETVWQTDGAFEIRWPSVSGRQYAICWTTNMSAGFSMLQDGIPASPPLNTYTDASDAEVMRFYRVELDP